jgi:hypothetical protein
MEVEYEQTPDDLKALQRHLVKHQLKDKRNPLVSAFVGIGVVLFAYLLVYLKDMVQIPFVDDLFSKLPEILVGALLTGLALVLHIKVSARNAMRKRLRAGRNAEKVLGWRRVVIDAQGVHITSKVSSTTCLWDGIDEVATTNAHVFFYIMTNSAFVVPRRAFPSDQAFDDFVDAARRYHGMAGGGDAVWEMTSDGLWERGGATGIQAPGSSGKSGTVEGIIPKEGL